MNPTLLQPKEITIDDKCFIISKFPAMDGREICSQYLTSAMPKIGNYKLNEELALKLYCFVAVKTQNSEIRLINRDLVNNHVPSWEASLKLEAAMMEYNCSFFQNGRVSTFFQDIAQKLPQWITKILTDSLASLSPKEKPHSTN